MAVTILACASASQPWLPADRETLRRQLVLSQVCRLLFPRSGTYVGGLDGSDLRTMRLVARVVERCLAPHLFTTVHLSDTPGKGLARLSTLLSQCGQAIQLVKNVVIKSGCPRISDDLSTAGCVQLVLRMLRALCRLPCLTEVRIQALPGRASVVAAMLGDVLRLRRNLPFDISVLEDDDAPAIGRALLLCATKAVALGVVFALHRELHLPTGARLNSSLLTDLRLERVVLTKENHVVLWGLAALRVLHLHDCLVWRTPGATPFDDFTWSFVLEMAEQSLPGLRRLVITKCGYARLSAFPAEVFVRIDPRVIDVTTSRQDYEAYMRLTSFLASRSLYASLKPDFAEAKQAKQPIPIPVLQLDWSSL